MAENDLSDLQMEAQLREADARLDALQAQARTHDAQQEMDEISGVRRRRDQKAEAALDDASQHLDKAYAAAASKYES